MTIWGLSKRVSSAVFRLIPAAVFSAVDLSLQQRIAEGRIGQLKRAGKNFGTGIHVVIQSPTLVSFGDDCYLNEFVHILGGGGVTVGNGVWVANHASIVSVTHPVDVEYIGQTSDIREPVVIEDHVWIGAHAVIMPGVTLGRSCVIGAGSVVTRNVPPYAVAVGVPAKIIRYKTISSASTASDGKTA